MTDTSRSESTPVEAASRNRAAWLDNLRVVLIGGVILAHAATAYVVDVAWYYEERTTSEISTLVVTFPVFLAAIFGLGPLFLIAGMMSARSLAGHGAAAFSRSRLLRLGLPLVFFCVVIDPVTDYLGHLTTSDASLTDYLVDRTGTRDFGPMWFVAALLLFSLLYAAWRSLRPRPLRSDEVLSNGLLLGFAAAIAVLSWLVWLRWSYTDDTPFDANFGHWGQASALFVLGIGCGERGWLATLGTARSRTLGWIAAAGALVIAAMAGYSLATDDFASMVAGPHALSVAFASVAGLVGVSVSLWVTAWFRRRWNHAGPLAQRAGRGSYAAYLIHPTVLVAVSLAFASVLVPPEVKFLLVAGIGVPATFALGYALTRVPGLRRVL